MNLVLVFFTSFTLFTINIFSKDLTEDKDFVDSLQSSSEVIIGQYISKVRTSPERKGLEMLALDFLIIYTSDAALRPNKTVTVKTYKKLFWPISNFFKEGEYYFLFVNRINKVRFLALSKKSYFQFLQKSDSNLLLYDGNKKHRISTDIFDKMLLQNLKGELREVKQEDDRISNTYALSSTHKIRNVASIKSTLAPSQNDSLFQILPISVIFLGLIGFFRHFSRLD